MESMQHFYSPYLLTGNWHELAQMIRFLLFSDFFIFCFGNNPTYVYLAREFACLLFVKVRPRFKQLFSLAVTFLVLLKSCFCCNLTLEIFILMRLYENQIDAFLFLTDKNLRLKLNNYLTFLITHINCCIAWITFSSCLSKR